MGISINFRDIADGFEALPSGEYTAVVEGVELRANKANTADYLMVTYKITSPEKFANRLVWDMISLNENALWQVTRALKDFGIPYKDLGLSYSMEHEGDKRVYTGLELGENTQKGQTFIGFITDDQQVWGLDGSVVKMDLENYVDEDYDPDKARNRVKKIVLVQRPKAMASVPVDSNNGARPKLV